MCAAFAAGRGKEQHHPSALLTLSRQTVTSRCSVAPCPLLPLPPLLLPLLLLPPPPSLLLLLLLSAVP